MKRVVFLVIIVVFSTSIFAQIKLSLLDGRQIKLESYVFHSEDAYMDYSYIKPNGELKNTFIDLEDVYSISLSGVDSVIYAPIEEGEFEVAQMQQIVYAKQFVQTEYNPWWALAAGLAIGSSSMFLPVDGLTKLVAPVAYVAIVGSLVKPTQSYIIKKHDYAQGDEWFIYGYQNGGRKKIFTNTVLGSVGGIFIAGAIVGTLKLLEK